MMRAIVQNDYGSPEVLKLAEVPKPVIEDNQYWCGSRLSPSMPGMCSPCVANHGRYV
jgi:hypothetical protein